MAKKRGLVDRDTLAGNDTDTDDKVDSNDTSKVNNEEVTDSIEGIITKVTNKPKPAKKPQVALYLDDDVARAFNHYASKEGKGAKSELVNELLRSALHRMKYMK